jgi:hypothetical protein
MKSGFRFINSLRKIVSYFLKNFTLILFFYNTYYRLKNKTRFYSEIEKRKNTSIFDYKNLSQPIPFYPIEAVKDSNFYGVYHSLKEYSGVTKIYNSIEHGLYLGNYVPFASYLRTTKSIITFSDNRKKHLINAKINKPIYKIGPYIHYAKLPVSENEFIKLKQSLGKTLLLFPSHSIKNFNVRMDVLELIEKVKKLALNYDSILVCLYYKDILDAYYLQYFEKAAFKIVTAGNTYDINFLSRLKLIIELADFTVSNTVGTHTGYCVYLNKPHFIIEQEVELSGENNTRIKNYRDEKQIESLSEEKDEILKEFSIYSESITEKQKKVIDKYWGISSIKQPEDLLDILKDDKN